MTKSLLLEKPYYNSYPRCPLLTIKLTYDSQDAHDFTVWILLPGYLSQFTFSRLFKKTYGIGFHEFLTRYRLREARRLLANPYTNIANVGLAVGFNDPSYFSRVFKKYYGQNPSAFLGKGFAKEYSNVVDRSYAPCPVERRK